MLELDLGQFFHFCRGGGLHSVASIFTPKLSASLYALKVIFTLPQQSFTIVCDSRSALPALGNCHPLVLAILEWLFLVRCRGHRVNFCWVSANVGVEGNEQADAQTKAVASNVRSPV